MIPSDMGRFLGSFNANPPASQSIIENVVRLVPGVLPEGYMRFLQFANGGEGFIGANTYAILWRIEELLSMNREHQVSEYAPGLFVFGSDGGGEAFAFDLRSQPASIVSVPFVGMALDLISPIAATFEGFLENSFKA